MALTVVRPVVVAMAIVAGRVIRAATVMADQVITGATIAMSGPVMLLTHVTYGIVTSMTGLGDAGCGDRAHGGD